MPLEIVGDVADVTGQPHALAIGRDIEILRRVGAVEHQRIGAPLTLDHVAAVAGIQNKSVIAVAEQRDVVAAAAVDDVIAVAADQPVVALASGDGVVAGAGIDRQLHVPGGKAGGVDDVVAAEGLDDEMIAALEASRHDRRRQAGSETEPPCPLT